MKKTIWITAIILMVLALIVQSIGLFSDLESKTIAICYFICVLITGLFLHFRKQNSPRQTKKRFVGFKFILFGSLAAILVEVLFWGVEIIVGSQGIAAHPNIFVDLAVVMPWYIAMITIFWFVNKRCGFSWQTAMLLGGLYELAADGIVGYFLGGNVLTAEYLLTLPLFFGVFVFIYFPMLAMPLKYYGVKKQQTDDILPAYKRFLFALLPMSALVPFAIIFLIIFA